VRRRPDAGTLGAGAGAGSGSGAGVGACWPFLFLSCPSASNGADEGEGRGILVCANGSFFFSAPISTNSLRSMPLPLEQCTYVTLVQHAHDMHRCAEQSQSVLPCSGGGSAETTTTTTGAKQQKADNGDFRRRQRRRGRWGRGIFLQRDHEKPPPPSCENVRIVSARLQVLLCASNACRAGGGSRVSYYVPPRTCSAGLLPPTPSQLPTPTSARTGASTARPFGPALPALQGR